MTVEIIAPVTVKQTAITAPVVVGTVPGYVTDHVNGDGSDHADVAANTAALATKAPNQNGSTTIASGATCTIPYDDQTLLYYFTANQDFSLALSGLPVSGAWAVVLMLDSGGVARTIGIPADWKAGNAGAVPEFSAGLDRVLIRGVGQDATSVIITVVETDIQ